MHAPRRLAATVMAGGVACSALTMVSAPARAATACSVAYSVSNSWPGGFQGSLSVRNTGDAWTSWTVRFTFAAGQSAAQGWGGTWTTGASPSISNAAYNGSVATGATVELGFIGSGNGGGPAPSSFSVNGIACGGGTPAPTTRPPNPTSPPPTTSRPPTITGPPSTTRPPTTRPPTTAPVPPGRPFKGVGNSACADLARLRVSWWYNWYINPGSCNAPGFVPLVSGKNNPTAGDVAWGRDQAVNGGYTTLLGFNEPNKTDQANMSVARAVELWPTLTANSSLRIGSPATSADGQAWFTSFMQQVAARNLRVDFIALHWYGWNAGSCDANATQFENYLRWAESFPGNRPIWITELGCMHQSNPSMASVQAFYRGVREVLARHPRVERYAWYPWNPNNNLVNPDQSLSPLGTDLMNAPSNR